MPLTRWIRGHRVLAGFAAGVLLTLVAAASVGYYILSDQRRSARVLASALSRALDREVRIDRVTDVGTDRVVMQGVELPREGGWPATVVVERVEATGPLLAAARGDASPVKLDVSRPTVDLGAGGGGGGLAGLEGLPETLRSFLSSSLQLDVHLAGGTARHTGGTAGFDLTLLKGTGEARGELTLHEAQGPPLTLRLQARLAGQTPTLTLTGTGGLAPVAAWLPAQAAAMVRDRALELQLDVDLGTKDRLAARGRARVGDALSAEGSATLAKGILEVALPRAVVDLDFAAAATGLGGGATGRAELSEVTATWRPEDGFRPTLRARLRLPELAVPPATAGIDVAAAGLDGRVLVEPAGTGLALSGEARLGRLRVAGLDAAPIETRYRVALDDRGSVTRAELDELRGRLQGAALAGQVAYDGGTRRLEARLDGDPVEAGDLARHLAPGWLGPADRLRLTGLRLTATGLDPRELQQGTVRLEARGFRLDRADGHITGGGLGARAELARKGVSLTLDAEGVASTLPALVAEVARLQLSGELARGGDARLAPERAALTARDREGRELVVATLGPAAAGRLRVAAQAPALERLDGFWPAIPRRLTGSARLEAELAGSDFQAGQGRLTLAVPEGELWNGQVSIRDLAADVPLRRGATGGEPPWGQVALGELIAYNVVVRDLTTPARLWRDRLSLNALTCALYSGVGKGWGEVDLQPTGVSVRGQLSGDRVRIEEFMSAYGIRGGTMTGLLKYQLDYQYRAGRLGLNGRFEVPEGGVVNIELLNRVMGYVTSERTGVAQRALENLRQFDYKRAQAQVQSAGEDLVLSLSMQGREQFLVFPAKVKEINIQSMPLSFLARQFPGS
jgi:hypothetical protein